MDKEDVLCMYACTYKHTAHAHTHTHTQRGTLLSNKKEWNLVTMCGNNDGSREHIILNEARRTKTNTVWFHLYVEPKKQNKWTTKTKQKQNGNSLAVQWLGLGTFTAMAQVQSLVRELRSCKLCIVAKKTPKQTQKHTHRYGEQTGGCQRGEWWWGEERNRWGRLRGTNFVTK